MIILIVILVLLVLYLFILFNSLQSPKQDVSEAWADIDAQLQRRADLIPNLVATVQGYATHEKELLENITSLRTQAVQLNKNDMSQREIVETKLGTQMATLFANVEAYPDLKANQNFLNLQAQLTKTEDEIASARRIYNDNVSIYNTKISTFPAFLLAGLLGYKPAPFFQYIPEKQQ